MASSSSAQFWTSQKATQSPYQSPQQAIKKIHEIVGNRPCYIPLDVDFLDPSVAAGTGTPVCGGFDTITAIRLLAGLEGVNLGGADVVEVSPPYDHAEIIDLAGATIATELLGLMASGKPDKT
jgi:agmatinase